MSKLRGICVLATVLLVVVGLALHVGTGTPSAFGIQQISAICPLGALETFVGLKGVMLHPLILFAVIVLVIVLVGKAFCAWMCPVPWLQKFFGGKSKDVRKKGSVQDAKKKPDVDAAENAEVTALKGAQAQERRCSACAASGSGTCGLAPLGGKRDGVQFDTRHAVLLGALGSAAVFGFPVFCLICPVGLTFATLIGVWNLFQFNEPSWALLIFPAILILEVTVLKKWCSKICPISALVGLIATANKTLRPRVSKNACLREKGIDCHACVDACPELLDPHSKSIPECSKCGECLGACPAKAISIKLLK